jgi:hypothetical protein
MHPHVLATLQAQILEFLAVNIETTDRRKISAISQGVENEAFEIKGCRKNDRGCEDVENSGHHVERPTRLNKY